MSFCELPSLLITFPRYVKLSTHSSVSHAFVRGASKVILIHITISAHWFPARHALQPTISYRSYLLSELEGMPSQPDHRRSQDHPYISHDRMKFITVSICVNLPEVDEVNKKKCVPLNALLNNVPLGFSDPRSSWSDLNYPTNHIYNY